MSKSSKKIIEGFATIFTFGMLPTLKKNTTNNIPNYWFNTGNYIKTAFDFETSKIQTPTSKK